MLKTLGIVQACFGSSRFHGLAGRRLGGQPLLSWVVRRVTDATQLDGVIVLARDPAEHRSVVELVPPDVPTFICNEADALHRFSRATEEYPAEAVVRIRGDSPFIHPGLIAESASTKLEFR